MGVGDIRHTDIETDDSNPTRVENLNADLIHEFMLNLNHLSPPVPGSVHVPLHPYLQDPMPTGAQMARCMGVSTLKLQIAGSNPTRVENLNADLIHQIMLNLNHLSMCCLSVLYISHAHPVLSLYLSIPLFFSQLPPRPNLALHSFIINR